MLKVFVLYNCNQCKVQKYLQTQHFDMTEYVSEVAKEWATSIRYSKEKIIKIIIR